MSTLSDVSKIFEAPSAEGQPQSLVVEAVRMLTGREGGLNDLIHTFEQKGLGHIISSWVGNGENVPISPDQIKAVMGSKCVADLAKKAGISPVVATRYLTSTLPNLVDALTPDGKVGSASALLSRAREILAASVANRQGS
jgi:uncharacterized protein YidB (DUF937 family)